MEVAVDDVGSGPAVRRRGETDLHKTLKKQACYWLHRSGYCCVAAEVKLPPVGIVDAVGSGLFRPYHNVLGLPKELSQVCAVECKATRSDFLRDCDNDGQLSLGLGERSRKGRSRRRNVRRAVGLGKFNACLVHPIANLHYILAPVGIIKKTDLPSRWGLLSYGPAGVTVVVRATWQEACKPEYVESRIARTLTGDIFRADGRAIGSVNRAMFAEQHALAERIRQIRPMSVLAAPIGASLTPTPGVRGAHPTMRGSSSASGECRWGGNLPGQQPPDTR